MDCSIDGIPQTSWGYEAQASTPLWCRGLLIPQRFSRYSDQHVLLDACCDCCPFSLWVTTVL